MLSELFTAGLIGTIISSIQEKNQVNKAKQKADIYFQRTNAERDAIRKADEERRKRREAREAKEAAWKAEQTKKAAAHPDTGQETESDNCTIHLDNISFQTGNASNSADFDQLFKDMEKLFSEKG